ncbi:hypothetical protein SteCoe_9600 [Stentor coeruleus]|uniref:Casein kinase I n=1 Tax=Stentor coeruleus TaxID=5963 RepID=A0A1R2CHI9_9CILI|nr:hypothetical protein SteCoe_9600 [Stentor coeruleus]
MEIFEERYQVVKPIARGCIYNVYKAIDNKTRGIVAVKVEKNHKNPNFARELEVINNGKSIHGLAKLLYQGITKGKRFIVMNYLGKSLESKFLKCHEKFSDGCVLRIADELLQGIENFHKIGYVHNNLKPKNILLGYSLNWQSLYLVGLSSVNSNIRNTHENEGYIEENINLLYSSTNVMKKITPSMRDDIESIAYILIHFHCGILPWKNSSSSIEVLKLKIEFASTKTNNHLFAALLNIINYAQSLEFNQEPDYKMLRNHLANFAKNKKVLRVYDWAISNDKIQKQLALDKSRIPISKHFGVKNDNKISELKDGNNCMKKRVRFGNMCQIKCGLTQSNNAEDCESKKLERVETEIMEDFPHMYNRMKILQQRKEFLEVLASSN